ncbi:MAG: alkaline phosphatase family protein [Planctomycetota bacterium]
MDKRSARYDPWDWPAEPTRTQGDDADRWLEYDLDGDGHAEYAQRLCGGYKRELHFRAPGSESPSVVLRPTPDGTAAPLLLLLLDGVAYERIRGLYDAGHFRLFHPPARLVSVFPTLTDPAYDGLFGTGPTPGFEPGFFDRGRNRLRNAFVWHLFGWNEIWVRHVDYRMPFIEDALMYLFPRWVYPRELRRGRRVLDARLASGRTLAVVYILSTDGLGHMLRPAAIDQELRRLDAWIERAVHDHRGQLDVVALADHGMGRVPAGCAHLRAFDLRGVLRAAGLHVGRRLRRPGDVILPVFGLLDVARLHTFDAATRDRAAAAVRACPEVELVAVRDGERVRVLAADEEAEIECREGDTDGPLFSYRVLGGDPLRLVSAVAALRAAPSTPPTALGTAREWLRHTAKAPCPVAPPRLWDAFFTVSREQPDVIVSLNDRCFVGSGVLSRFVRMQGTHGGLHRRATETFIMSTRVTPPSPMYWADVGPWLSREYGWRADAASRGAGPRKR